MRQLHFILIFLFSVQLTISQKEVSETNNSSSIVDNLYKEDQFYFAVSYNLLTNMPENMSQKGFSTGFTLGYIKDIPLNSNRNFGLGIGLGISTNSYNHNLKISKSNGFYNYDLVDLEDFTKNKFSTQLVELPIELRWRTSTPEEYKFWRIYAGVKLGYIVASKAKSKGGGETIKISNLAAIEKLRYGLTLSAGYSTWNVNLYYGLNPIFDDSVIINGEKTDIRIVKIGLKFYIL
ncbi:MAG: PorT family protein [Flavobacteriaceae bacterium]|nr:PorT family protein [Flavobacteriaceae bacterium]